MAVWQVVEILYDADDTPIRRSVVDEAESEAAAQRKADALNRAGHESPEPGHWYGYGVARFPPEGD